ncbi:hypothetical protein EDB87DRAFT_1713014 [Lactarius vividus]|nr:hypothetical protein EDB87DRAFT_1713014 [Lactarius vividus]
MHGGNVFERSQATRPFFSGGFTMTRRPRRILKFLARGSGLAKSSSKAFKTPPPTQMQTTEHTARVSQLPTRRSAHLGGFCGDSHMWMEIRDGVATQCPRCQQRAYSEGQNVFEEDFSTIEQKRAAKPERPETQNDRTESDDSCNQCCVACCVVPMSTLLTLECSNYTGREPHDGSCTTEYESCTLGIAAAAVCSAVGRCHGTYRNGDDWVTLSPSTATKVSVGQVIGGWTRETGLSQRVKLDGTLTYPPPLPPITVRIALVCEILERLGILVLAATCGAHEAAKSCQTEGRSSNAPAMISPVPFHANIGLACRVRRSPAACSLTQ